MNVYEIIGGYSYGRPIEIEAESIREAGEAWLDRYLSNGRRLIDGVYWPVFGDMADEDYAVIDHATDEFLTRSDILMFHIGQDALADHMRPWAQK